MNWSLPTPKAPNFVIGVQSGLMMWRLYCLVLATQISPVAWSTATPRGQLNWPVALPRTPQVLMIVPSGFMRTMRWWTVSATVTTPAASKAIPLGSWNTAVSVVGGITAPMVWA